MRDLLLPAVSLFSHTRLCPLYHCAHIQGFQIRHATQAIDFCAFNESEALGTLGVNHTHGWRGI